MKKYFFVALMAMIISAQGAFAQKFELGVKAGLNVSTLSSLKNLDENNPLFNIKSGVLPAFHAGFIAEYHINHMFSISPELLYSFQGGKIDFKGKVTGNDGNLKIKSHYINIPLLVKVYPISRLALELGPQIGFNMGVKEAYEYTVATINNNGVTNLDKEDFNVFDFGLAVGANVRIIMGLNAGVRYVHGFTNTVKNVQVADIINKEVDSKNRTFQVYIGYNF